MNEWKFQQRRKKRGDWCLIDSINPSGPKNKSGLCGCGTRHQPTKRYKNRIIKRFLSKQLSLEISGIVP